MKSLTLKAAVLAALSLSALQASATGFVTLPTSGATAYVSCRTAPNFGSLSDTSFPTAGVDNACAILSTASAPYNAVSTIASVPETGYSLVAGSAFTTAIPAFAETVATLNERVWRNAGTSECIYGKQVLMSSAAVHDYNPAKAGNNGMEVNDFAFGGFSGAVKAAYSKGTQSNYSSAYRIGRTFTSVQMQSVSPFTAPAPSYLVLPTAGGTVGTEINGVGQTLTPPGVPTAAQQQAPFSANWVDFTVDTSGVADEDGFPNLNSPIMYIKQSCASGAAATLVNGMKLRQTGQETQPWVIVTTSTAIVHAPGTNVAP